MSKIKPLEFFLILCAIGCSSPNSSTQQTQKAIVINLDDKNKFKEKEFWELFEIDNVTELEFKEDYFLSSIYRLKITETEIFALDVELGNLFRYSLEGKFLNRIGKIGDGPKELPQIGDFYYNSANNELILASGGAMRVSRFSPDGNFIETIKLKDQMDRISGLNGHTVLTMTYFNSLYKYLAVFDAKGDTVKTLFPFPKEVFPISLRFISGHLTTGSNGGLLFNEPASSTIYEINEELIASPKYIFIASNDFWPESERHQLNSYFEKLATGELTFLSKFYEESEGYLFFGLNARKKGGRRYAVDPRIGFYDKTTGISYLSNSEDFLMKLSGPLETEGGSFIAVLQKYEFAALLTEDENWQKESIGFSLLKEAKDGDFDNPILIKFKVRTQKK